MKNYKKEMDSIHMSEDLKQKIRNLPYENKQTKKTLSLPKILIPLSLVLLLFVGFLSITILNPKEANKPSKKENTIMADNGKQRYTPTKSGMIGGMGGTSTLIATEKPNNDMGYIPKKVPLYQSRYEQSFSIYPLNEKDNLELNAWLNEYAQKLSINETIDELYYRNQDVALMIMPDASLSITLSNIATTAEKESAKSLETQIKEKVQPLLSFKKSVWECDETYVVFMKRGKPKKILS